MSFDVERAKRDGCEYINGDWCCRATVIAVHPTLTDQVWINLGINGHMVAFARSLRNLPPCTDPTSKDYAGPWPVGWVPTGEFRTVKFADVGYLGEDKKAVDLVPKYVEADEPRHILRRVEQEKPAMNEIHRMYSEQSTGKPKPIRVAVQVERNRLGNLESVCREESEPFFVATDPTIWRSNCGNTVEYPRTVIMLPGGNVVDERDEQIERLTHRSDRLEKELLALRERLAALAKGV